jgi:hypothetical protein
MTKMPRFSSIDPRYHTHEECKILQSLERLGMWTGTGGKPHCPECQRLEALDREQAGKNQDAESN